MWLVCKDWWHGHYATCWTSAAKSTSQIQQLTTQVASAVCCPSIHVEPQLLRATSQIQQLTTQVASAVCCPLIPAECVLYFLCSRCGLSKLLSRREMNWFTREMSRFTRKMNRFSRKMKRFYHCSKKWMTNRKKLSQWRAHFKSRLRRLVTLSCNQFVQRAKRCVDYSLLLSNVNIN